MPKIIITAPSRTRPKRPASRRSRSKLNQRGAVALLQPLKFRNSLAVKLIGGVALVGLIVVGVSLAGSATYSLWSGTDKPAVQADTDNVPVELGVRFKADQDGIIKGVRFYKSRTNTGAHTGS